MFYIYFCEALPKNCDWLFAMIGDLIGKTLDILKTTELTKISLSHSSNTD